MEPTLADLRSDFELLEAETFEVLDYEDAPEVLASTSTSSSTTSCTGCSSCA
jgi:thiazolylpeptide-type bacteriocin precursor